MDLRINRARAIAVEALDVMSWTSEADGRLVVVPETIGADIPAVRDWLGY